MVSKITLFFKKHKKKFKVGTAFILVLILISFLFRNSINTIILDTVEFRSKSLATRAMNSAVADVILNTIVYDDLVHIITDEFGNISMIQANTLEINNLSKDLSQTTESKIEEFGKAGFLIPVGSFTGIPLLVGRGPKIKLKVMPVGSINCSFSSQFETAGINQTNHKIYLKINADVGVVLPIKSKRYSASRQVLISESIIVGQVPEVYLYSDTLDTLLNFVPY